MVSPPRGARMHCEESGCGDILVESDEAAIETAKQYVTSALAAATPLGRGFGPLEHFVGCTVRSKPIECRSI